MNKYTIAWQKLRQNYWAALAFDVAAILVVFVLIHSWQARHLLPGNGAAAAPDFVLQSLQQQSYQLSDFSDRKTIVYFFSPSCGICNQSMPNLQKLRESTEAGELQIFAVALAYNNREEVVEFANRHEFSFPVLLGTWTEVDNYAIRGFPTYYVIDAGGRVDQRSVGYTTLLGLRWRSSS